MIEFLKSTLKETIPILLTVKQLIDELTEIPYFKAISILVGIGGTVTLIVNFPKILKSIRNKFW